MSRNMKYLIGEIKKVEKSLVDDPTDIENIIYLEELKNDLNLEYSLSEIED